MKLIADPLPWTVDAACLTVGPETFFPEAGASQSVVAYRLARQVCAGCALSSKGEVEAGGRYGAVSRSGRYGMYGGMSPTERWELAKGRRAA